MMRVVEIGIRAASIVVVSALTIAAARGVPSEPCTKVMPAGEFEGEICDNQMNPLTLAVLLEGYDFSMVMGHDSEIQ